MQKTVTVIILLVLLGCGSASGQEIQEIPEGDGETLFFFNEMTGEFENYPSSPESVDSLLALGADYRNSDSRRSFFAARAALELSREIDYLEGEASSHNLMGIKYSDFGEYDLALQHYLEAMKLEEQLGNREAISLLINNRGLIHMELGNYDLSVEYLTESKEIREDLGLDFHTQVNNIGVSHRRQGNYDEALEYFKNAAEQAIAADDSLLHMIATLNIGNTYRNKGDLESAEGYIFRAANHFERMGNKNFSSASHLLLGRLYLDQNAIESALEHAEMSLEIADGERLRERSRAAHQLLADIHERNGNFEDAYRHFQTYQVLHDSLLNIQKSNQISQLQIQFEVEQKDRTIQLLNNESELQEAQILQQNMWHNFLLIGLGAFALIVGLLYKYNNQKKVANEMLEQKNREINKQNEQLHRLNEEKDEFLGMAAHDLRTPLSGISSCVSMIRDTDDLTREETLQYYDLIEMAVDRMVGLINNLLDVNSLENGSDKLETKPMDVEKPIHKVVNSYRETAAEKNIDLVLSLDPRQRSIAAEEEAVQRIMENLISNAIKFSPHGARVEVSSSLRNGHLELTVSDNGPGIPIEEQKQLFQRFSRLSPQPTGNESSVGLGLFIVRKLTEAMNGTVHCESQPGKGTSFILTFPVAAEEVYA